MLEEVRGRAADFDIIHFHIDFLHAPLLRVLGTSAVTTHHGRLDLPDLSPFYGVFYDLPLVAISNDQRAYLKNANWIGTVYHGLPRDLLPFQERPSGGYLAFLGRISPEKGPDRAIEIAAKAHLPLKIAAKIDRVDQSYWDDEIRPLIERYPNVEFIGEINEGQKAQFLGEASALLFPVEWPEPFGLVMIEAMACGTPVIAFRRGSVPEIVENGTSGFIVDTVEQAVDAVHRIPRLDRSRVRATFEQRFTVERMAQEYVEIYRTLVAQRRDLPLRPAANNSIRADSIPVDGVAPAFIPDLSVPEGIAKRRRTPISANEGSRPGFDLGLQEPPRRHLPDVGEL
jgi:glycosyltransferase involved in cell wall biosynthesis